MIVRLQGRKYQVIRSVYDSDLKRCRQKMIGSFDSYLNSFPSSIIDLLTDDEKIEAEKWGNEKTASHNRSMKFFAISNAPEKFKQLTELVSSTDADTQAQVDKYLEAMLVNVDLLRKALKKREKAKKSLSVKAEAEQ
ncbi:hypothetical protein C1H71_20260 (plasmid) [Iodobacter fluviatilis]|uniref:Uncharacterized protein n=2 Tax=Iodobacter fluviatilis TaxID=537 RepID=A0A7G3GFB8_9NEIS|nr:hypothetical protein C1H71_20260 [Iodobacter fluviatilis]